MPATDHISKLYLFAKETEAIDTLRGFKFQELKTLEIWLHNKVNRIDENIYCEYEDDIFQRDLKDFKATFRQIKLYSSKRFSFSSQELQKSLHHFFTLYVKGEYLFDKSLFVFETNTSFTIQRGDDDPQLLLEWHGNQGKLSEDLITRCIRKVKHIIESYIDSRVQKATEQEKSDFEAARATYQSLPDETWRDFINSINWISTEMSSEEALEQSVTNCVNLIRRLPFPMSGEQPTIVFDKLRGIVSDKSIAPEPEGRLLTNDLMDHALLNLGSSDDKSYSSNFELWKDIEDIIDFRVGEFYQVLYSAKHCRRNNYLENHSSLWLNLIYRYLAIIDENSRHWRQAVYEFIWSLLRPSLDAKPVNSLDGHEEILSKFFENIEEQSDLSSIEDIMNLLTLTATHQKLGLVNIEFGRFVSWFDQLSGTIEKVKKGTIDSNSFCSLLEIEAFTYLNRESLDIGEDNHDKAIQSLNEIIPKLEDAPFYAVSQLGSRLDEIIRLKARFGILEGYEDIEVYVENLSPQVKEREGNFSLAKRYINKASDYLHSINPFGLLKALDFFHKAQDLYFEESTYEGLVLCLMNISQLYASIRMNIAAKYYAISAIWFCSENDDPKLYKRISDSYGLLYHTDYKQGSWMEAIIDFEGYLNARVELDPSPFDPINDEMLQKTIVQHTLLIALMPKVSNQLGGLIQYEISRMGQLYDDYLLDGVEWVAKQAEKLSLSELIERKIDNPPINDIGAKREISWKCFGIRWIVEFENGYVHNSIAEEFVALIQIVQVDIALSRLDFHFLKCQVRIQTEIVDDIRAPECLPSDKEVLWKVYLSKLDSKESGDKNFHYTKISSSFQLILNDISLLNSSEFNEKFELLYKNGLANKTLSINSYQREYRRVYDKEKFNAQMRDKFNAEIIEIEYKESGILGRIEGKSEYYSKKNSESHIRSRIKGCLKSIHCTLERLSKSESFRSMVSIYRDKGYFDWQILLTLVNVIVDQKAKHILDQNGKIYETSENWLEDFHKAFHEIMNLDEEDINIEIPEEDIIGEQFEFQIRNLPIFVLESFGLESKSKYPNTQAIKDLLDERFNFSVDDIPEISPFKF